MSVALAMKVLTGVVTNLISDVGAHWLPGVGEQMARGAAVVVDVAKVNVAACAVVVTSWAAIAKDAVERWERPADVNEAVQWFVIAALIHTFMYPVVIAMMALTIAVMHTGNWRDSLNFQAAWVAVAFPAAFFGFHMQVFWAIACAHIASFLGQHVFSHNAVDQAQQLRRTRSAASSK
jgi:hypothetical protein